MIIHVVSQGDTVWKIAEEYGVSPQRVAADNGLVQNRLVIGQALLILIPDIVHTVRRGETLADIAREYGVTEMELIQNNSDLGLNRNIYTGQTLVISYTDRKQRSIAVNGYAYTDIMPSVLKRTLPYLSSLTVFGYGITKEGELIPIDDDPLIEMAWQNESAPVMVLSSITEDGTFSGTRARALFRDLALQNKVLNQVIALMRQKGYVGLDIDFEYIPAEDAEYFLDFLRNAANKLHAAGYRMNTDLAPKTSAGQSGLLYESHDYAQVGAISDTVLLMTYEWGYTYGPPMAVAPINQVRRVVEYAVTEIPPEKIMLGIPNYAYDWILPFEKGITRATGIGNEYAVQIAAKNGAEIQFDPVAQSPYFYYWDRERRQHVVWFEDVRSIQAKYNLVSEFGLRGAGYWNVMRLFQQNWMYASAKYEIRKPEF